MKKFYIVIILFLILFLFSFLSNLNLERQEKLKIAKDQKDQIPEEIFQIYNGDLPCVDCEKLNMEVTFTRKVKSKGDISGEFTLIETYVGRGEPQKITEGRWSGFINNKKETILTINSDKEKKDQKYFLLEDDSILLLDENMKIIEPVEKYRLQRL